MGATIQCSFGLSPSTLTVLPVNMVTAGTLPAASVNDTVPMTNVMPFGMCIAPTNPAFIAATSAALGTPTPVPCVPIIPSPWAPGATKVQIRGAPALHGGCMAMCTWAGAITISNPGQVVVQVI
jgi:hypothetical protein